MRGKGLRTLSKQLMTLAIVIVTAVMLFDSHGATQQPKSPAASKPPQVRSIYGRLPLSFEENRGQTDARVKFLARGRGYTLFLTSTEAVLKLRAPSPSIAKHRAFGKIRPVGLHPEPEKFSSVRIRLEGANPDSQASGVEQLPGKTNYFIGKDSSKWRRNVPTFTGVKFRETYPGVDLIYRGAEGRIEYDFAVAPGADPGRIRLRVDGADGLSLDAGGRPDHQDRKW
jgi:hypothetical protein